MARYEKQVWQNGASGTPLSASRLNKLETQFDRAIESVEADIADENSGIGTALRTTIAADLADGTSTIGSAAKATMSQTVAPAVVGSLKRWYARLAEDPATAKIVFLGDSTTENATNLFSLIRDYYTRAGQPLAGMVSGNIVNGGNSGWSLAQWLTDAAGANAATYSLADLVADDPDLIVFSFGINDVRQGGTTLPQLTARIIEAVDLIRDELPAADILLRMPNSLTTTVVGSDYVDGITHQAATDILRNAYLNMIGAWTNVVVADVQTNVTGTAALATSYLMQDELHPSGTGYQQIGHYLGRNFLGPSKVNLSALGPRTRRFTKSGYISGAGNGYIDLSTLPGDNSGSQPFEWPTVTSDVLYVDGSGIVSLSGSTFTAQGNNQRILKTGDWTALSGKNFTLFGDHPGEGSIVKYPFTFDPASIAAGGTLDVTVTISGATTDMAVILQPSATIFAAGIMAMAWVSATDTVTIRFHNTTASAVDMASSSAWRVRLVR